MGKIVRESGDLFETLVAPNHSWSTAAAATSHPDNNTFNSMSSNGWDRQLNNQFDSVWSSLGEGNSSGGQTNSGSSQTNSGYSNTNSSGSNGPGWNSQLNSQFDSIWSFGDQQQQQSNANQGQAAAAANTSGGGSSGQNSRTAANNGGNADALWRGQQMTVAGGGDRAWRA